jgi:hypothetical protein
MEEIISAKYIYQKVVVKIATYEAAIYKFKLL